ncbi:MAG: winged helix-turn-helix transcriptional regulator [Planctomycetota bacterium]
MWVEFPLSEAYRASLTSGEIPGPREKTGEKTREKTRDRILALIAEQPTITTAELAKHIGITAKGIEWQLGKLKADGRIRRVGPDRGGHWEVVESSDE